MSLVVNDAEKRITNPYGGGHNGVDIGWRSNEAENEVWANCAGEVVEVQDGLGNIPNATGVQSWGNYVYIKHPNGMYTRYAHLKSGIHVKVGDKVNALTSLGYIGDSGNANGRHLHFEVSERYDSRYRIDPTPYLMKPVYDGEVEEVPNVDKSIDELAREVLEGKYGNGKVRKDALGDKYDEVQKRVNQILNGETNEVIYEVQSGDTLSSIARKFNKVWKDIYNDNRAVIGSNPSLIFRGQKLVIR